MTAKLSPPDKVVVWFCPSCARWSAPRHALGHCNYCVKSAIVRVRYQLAKRAPKGNGSK